ncbi:MAG: DUF4861 family protein, partial [Bacteroidota bacterium]
MKPTPYLALILLVSLAACQSPEVQLTLSLPAGIGGSDIPVSIPVSELFQQGIANTEEMLWAPFAGDRMLPFQYEDHDQDGQPDTLFFQIDIKADQEQLTTFKMVKEVPTFPIQTNLRLGKKTDAGVVPLDEAPRLNTYTNTETQAAYQFEGVGWENDKVAFRNYLDLRNGIDIFGKTTTDMVLDEVGLDNDENYHHFQEWGMDVLKVGSSLGAGSIGIWYQDSLIRLTGHPS